MHVSRRNTCNALPAADVGSRAHTAVGMRAEGFFLYLE